ncbi:14814_t:CDS:2, partial [Gigaspora rosea]
MLQHVEEGNCAEDLCLNVLQAINFIIQAWDEVGAATIRNSDDDLADILQALKLSYPMTVEEFLNIPDENIVYEPPEDDQIIEELAYLFRNPDDDIDLGETDDSYESPIINASTAMSSLETV